MLTTIGLAVIAIVGIAWFIGAYEDRNKSRKGGKRSSAPKGNGAIVPFPMTFTEPLIEQGVISVQSDSSQEIYQVSLRDQTCTCKDFSKRKKFQKNSLSRLCKHLVREMGKSNTFANADSWVQYLAERDSGGPMKVWLAVMDSAKPVLITKEENDEWLNVYAAKQRKGEKIADASGPIERFGWSIDKNRWSYGDGPPGSRELTPMMREYF